MSESKGKEPPCAETGKPCRWVIDEWENADGTLGWDLLCFDCYRSRDWAKDECE
jgi:hypothetical protein